MDNQKPAFQAPMRWPDRLRNLATVMVITIHVAAPVAHVGEDLNTAWWWTGNFWNSLARAGVPLFVMLSGFLLLSKDYPLTYFLKRRFSRVVVPALFWMVVYSTYNFVSKGSPANFKEAAVGIFSGPVHYHLWFIYLIIGLYLIYPVLRAWVRVATEQEFLYFFTLCILCTWVYKFIWTFTGVGMGIYFELFTNNCGYFVLGYYLGKRPWPFESPDSSPMARWLPTGLIVLGTGATMLGSYLVNLNRGEAPMQVVFYDYLTPNVGIAAIGWFLLAKQAFDRHTLLDIEQEFSAASFGIYFAHVAVMDWWSQCGWWHSKTHSFVWLTGLIGLVTCIAFLSVSFIRVLPGGKRIT